MKKKYILSLMLSLVACFGLTSKAEAVADVTGLVPVAAWDFDSQPNSSGLASANKGSVSISFTHEGSVSYVQESVDKYSLNTANFTPYSGAVSVPPKTGLTISMLMTLGTNPNGITFCFRTGSNDVVIRRGDDAGTLLVGIGSHSAEISKYLSTSITNGDTEYHLVTLTVEETGMALYIDGVLKDSTTNFTAWHKSQILAALQFGSRYGGNKGVEKRGGGYIADMRIYDDILSMQQIDALVQELDLTKNMYFYDIKEPFVMGTDVIIDYSLHLYESKTADVSFVYDTDPSFSNPTTIELDTGLKAGQYTAILNDFNPGKTYYFKFVGENDATTAESNVGTFDTAIRIDSSEYLKRLEIKIPGYAGNTVLTNFPVLVTLSEETISGFKYSECFPNGSDIVCTTKNNLVIPHEFDAWNTEGTSYVWVRIPELSGKETVFYLYFGAMSQEAIVEPTPEKVWVNYAAVFHGESATVDATGNSDTVVASGITSITPDGMVASAMTKSKNNSIGIQFSNPVKSMALSSVSELTISGWFKKTNSGTGIVAANKNEWSGSGFLALVEQGTYFSASVDGTHQGASGKGALVKNEWGYLAFSYENTMLKSYLNGEQVYEKSDAKLVNDSAQTYWALGSYTGKGDDSISGDMDELRVYNGVASSDWIKAEYDSVMNASTFVEIVDVAELNTEVPVLAVPNVSKNIDGTITVTVDVSSTIPSTINCIVGENVFEMATDDIALPQIYSATISGVDPGTYVARIEATSSNGSVVNKSSSQFYFGALNVDVISSANENTMESGLFRISRSEIGAIEYDLAIDCIFTGEGLPSTDLPENMGVIIPAGELYVDIPVKPVYSPEIDHDAEVVLTTSGQYIVLNSVGTMTIKNIVDNVFVCYVSPTGDDANRGLTEDTPKKTISAAVEALIPYSEGKICTVYVAEGLYKNSRPVYVTNAIHVLGMSETISDVVVSNSIDIGWNDQNQRNFILNHKDAVVAGMTLQNGGCLNMLQGGSIFIDKNGGTVSNCVIEAAYTYLNSYASGARLEAGLVTHCIFRDNLCGSDCGDWQGYARGGVLELNGTARAENCLLENNSQYQNVSLVHLYSNSIMRNCTIINSGLSVTNAYCKEFSPLLLDSNSQAINVVIAGVTNKIDGAACGPTGKVANFINGAVDCDITGLGFNENTIVGTKEDFFTNYADGNYRPKTGGVLANAGLNYEGMSLYDLTGTQQRVIGGRIDIGCYESYDAGTLLILK
ncbi:MAG: hypothetical protein J6V41_02450 [Kiritimatiellae bacterium]|nr:hypothetical protein [Kiritimatiellia bacterium]